MTVTDTGRPAPDEHIPYFNRYIDVVPDGDIFDTLERQIDETRTFLATLTPAQASWRPAPGEWSATEIVGHLADTERILGYRALRLARGDDTQPEGVEFEQYAVASGYAERDMPSVAFEFATVRHATLAWLRGLNGAAWERRAPDSWSCRSVRGFVWILAGHEIHHMLDIRRIP